MSRDAFQAGSGFRGAPDSGALLLCRAEPDAVAPAARLLRERMLLTRAGDAWSVLVPEGGPWLHGGEPVDRVLTEWATALAVGTPWPVLALWWDDVRAGYCLASGFRRPVGYIWLADGTPAGERDAMHGLAARLRLDPVLDMQSLDGLTEPDPEADARARLHGLLAVLARAGVFLPVGLAPGEPGERLRAAVSGRSGTRRIEGEGWRDVVRAELDVVERGRLGAWQPWSGEPRARALALALLAGGVPVTVFGVRRRRAGWVVAGVLSLGYGAVGLAYEVVRPRD